MTEAFLTWLNANINDLIDVSLEELGKLIRIQSRLFDAGWAARQSEIDQLKSSLSVLQRLDENGDLCRNCQEIIDAAMERKYRSWKDIIP